MSQFILPYLLAEVLLVADSPGDACREITAEIRCVLVPGGIGGRETNESVLERVARSGFQAEAQAGGGGGDSHRRRAVHSIFLLLDTLHAWIVSAEQDQFKKSEEKASQLPYFEKWTALSVHINALVQMVPKLLLARAAMSVDANARALRYLEQHAREEHRSATAMSAVSSGNDDITLISPPVPLSSSSAGDMEVAKKQHFSLLPANTELPPLTPELADCLLECYARLGDSDSLQGVVKLRRRCEPKPSFFSRLCLLEHADQHSEALREYNSFRDSLALSRRSCTASQNDLGSGGGGNEMSTNLQRSFTERGRLRCLKEMGQLHAVLDQVFGGLVEPPPGNDTGGALQVECALLPTAIEAAWE